MTGVRRTSEPRTVTVTVFPTAGVQLAGVQATVTPDGATLANDPWASSSTRHITRLVVVSQGWPAWNEVGVLAAWNAPSRAAFVSEICA
jgi:hypothetical protein